MTTHTELFMLTPGPSLLTSSVWGEVVRDFPGRGGGEMGPSFLVCQADADLCAKPHFSRGGTAL